jgi:predicted RNA polymerase sigma factor
LLELTQSPVVAMNRAVAISRVDGALAGLAALDAIENLAALDRVSSAAGDPGRVVARGRRRRSRNRVLSRRAGAGAVGARATLADSRLSLLV